MGFFTKNVVDEYEDKNMNRLLAYSDIALELAEKLPNASSIRVDSYGLNLNFFKPGEVKALEQEAIAGL